MFLFELLGNDEDDDDDDDDDEAVRGAVAATFLGTFREIWSPEAASASALVLI